jgi:hypothetical protein
MRPTTTLRRIATVIAALGLAAASVGAAAAPALAKEGLDARLDAPIALGTPAGTELLVGVTVSALDEDGVHPVYGSPIVLILSGRDGTETEAHGVEDASGHYVMRITVPSGGARGARVVMRGMGSDGPADIEMRLAADPFAFGGVTTGTAQLAPAPTPGLTPLPRASAATVDAAAQVAAPVAATSAADPAPAMPAPSADTQPARLVALAAVIGAILLVIVLVVAMRRRSGGPEATGTAGIAPDQGSGR